MANAEDETHRRRNKRYKTFLDPNYEEHWVSPRVHSSWIAKTTDTNKSTAALDLTDDTSEVSCGDDAARHVSETISPRSTLPLETSESNTRPYQSISTEGSSRAESVSDDRSFTEQGEYTDSDDDDDHYQEVRPADIPDDVNDDHTIMFETSALSVVDVMQMVIAYCVRFCLSHEARAALVEMIKCMAGPRYEQLQMTRYKIKKQYDPPADVVTYTFFCTSCKFPVLGPVRKNQIQNTLVTCEECLLQQHLTMQSANRFLYVDLKYQFRELLSTQTIRQSLMDNLAVRNAALAEDKPTAIKDIYDGELYKATIKKYSQKPDDIILTYNINTDGMPIFNSSKRSSWPLLLILNELPHKIRFTNVLLVGLWVGDKEPTATMMNTFLQQFISQANCLTEEGITLKHRMGCKTTFKLVPLCCIADSVARPIVQNRLQYNGYHGCSWCYAHGKYVRGAVRYCFDEMDANLRTHESHMNDVEMAAELGKSINGVKGASILLQLPLFNMVWGFPFEYMHAILLGVIKLLWDIWTTHGSPVYLTPTQRSKINGRLMKMTPVHEVQRSPRPLSEKCKWKASEWLSWLVFYSLPCLNGILPDAALKHLSLLVESTFILLKINIRDDELNKCEVNLLRFVAEFEILYGEEFLTFNVHSLLHVVSSVKMSGPLWATSAFSFESTNFRLKRMVNGPKGVDDQIAIRFLQQNLLHWKLEERTQNAEPHMKYYKKLFTRSKSKTYTRTTENTVLLGNGRTNCDNADVVYQRCIFEGVPLHSAAYKQGKKKNDSMVRLITNDIVRITGILKIDDGCYVDVQKINIDGEFHARHVLQVRNFADTVQRIPISQIKEKVMVLNVDDSTYICEIIHIVE